jgi:hypothetical protein
MTSKLDVTVAVDLGSGTITVTPTGELTVRNVHGLLPIASRAASLAPGCSLTMDLRKLAAAQPQALQILQIARPKDTRIPVASIPVTARTRPERNPGVSTRRTYPARAVAA